MKVHPAILFLLVVAALAGAFAVGRLGVAPAPAAVPVPAPVAAPAPPPLPGAHVAEIPTANGTIKIEGTASMLPTPALVTPAAPSASSSLPKGASPAPAATAPQAEPPAPVAR